MASDHLLVEMSPVLLEALSLPGESGTIDYFQFVSVDRDSCEESKVDAGVLERTKELRRWQNSPRHGPEVVKLLPLLHRVARILKDPKRRASYEQELNRFLSGEQRDPVEDFHEMVRAALVDGTIEDRSRAELLRYAEQNDIDRTEAERILRQYAAALPEPSDEDLETGALFKVEAGGPADFRKNLERLLESGRLTRTTGEKAIQAASTYRIEEEEAASILAEVRSEHFRQLVKRVAGSGTISNNQARLLMPKAQTLSVPESTAFEIISQFTFTGASQEELADMSLVSAGFEASEIDDLLSKHETVVYEPRRSTSGSLFAGFVKFVAPVLILGAIGYGAFWGWSEFASSSQNNMMEPTPVPEVAATPSGPWTPPVPDPVSGLLTFDPVEPDDPPAFQFKIQEVTCREYRQFLVANLYQNRPPGWGLDYSYPEGMERHPVTGISAQDALEYCWWIARKMDLKADRVRLPTVAEFRRALRALNASGQDPTVEGFWRSAGLTGSQSATVRKNPNDTLLHPNGQMYDLIGNVREWATDDTGRMVVVGGSYQIEDPDFDVTRAKPAYEGKPAPDVGFRILISPPAPI